MTTDHSRVLAELPLPLASDADLLEAIGIAVAVEDACQVTLPDDVITVSTLGQRSTIEAMLDVIAGPD